MRAVRSWALESTFHQIAEREIEFLSAAGREMFSAKRPFICKCWLRKVSWEDGVSNRLGRREFHSKRAERDFRCIKDG